MSAVETRVANGVGHLLLNRPDVMNAVTVALARGLRDALVGLAADEPVRVIAVRGAGGNFCAGGDFHEVQRLTAEGADSLRGLFVAFRDALATIDRIDVPVVAVVEGNAMAGGFELLQAADIVLAREDARLCDNHVNFGQIPGGGGSQRLPRLLGRQAALAHLLGGERLSGADAASLGLVQHAWPAGGFDERVEQYLTRLASRDPAAVRRIKRLVVDGSPLPLEDALELELAAVVDHITAPERPSDYTAAFSSRSSS